MKRVLLGTMLAMVACGLVFAGQGKGKKRGDVDLSTVRTVTGTVASVTMDCGLGHPGFVLGAADGTSLDVHLGPYWYLVANNFAVAVGDGVTAKVADCPSTQDPADVVAFEVTDTTTGAAILLRNDLGIPLWSGPRRHGGSGQNSQQGQERNGCRFGGYGIGSRADLSTLTGLDGAATALHFGLGTHSNTMVFTSGGTDYALGLGPYWYMLQQGFAVEVGDSLHAAIAQCNRGWVAFSLDNLSTGKTLQLRDENGVPLWLD